MAREILLFPGGEKHACLSPSGLHATIFSLAVFVRVTHNGQSERGTIYSLRELWLVLRMSLEFSHGRKLVLKVLQCVPAGKNLVVKDPC